MESPKVSLPLWIKTVVTVLVIGTLSLIGVSVEQAVTIATTVTNQF